MKDGPFLLGGLIKNRTGESQEFFKDLPFWVSRKYQNKVSIMVFVTPTRVFSNEIQELPEFSELEQIKETLEMKP